MQYARNIYAICADIEQACAYSYAKAIKQVDGDSWQNIS